MADEDPRIAAFARTNRRRNATITLLLGIILVTGGAIGLFVMFATDAIADSADRTHNDAYQLAVWFAGGVVVGLVLIVRAILLFRKR